MPRVYPTNDFNERANVAEVRLSLPDDFSTTGIVALEAGHNLLDDVPAIDYADWETGAASREDLLGDVVGQTVPGTSTQVGHKFRPTEDRTKVVGQRALYWPTTCSACGHDRFELKRTFRVQPAAQRYVLGTAPAGMDVSVWLVCTSCGADNAPTAVVR